VVDRTGETHSGDTATAATSSVKDQIEAATGVKKGDDHGQAMSDLRDFYKQQELEAQNVQTVSKKTTDQMLDVPGAIPGKTTGFTGAPLTKADGTPWGYEVSGSYDVREFSHGVTAVEIRVHLDGSSTGATPADIERIKADATRGVDEKFNNQHSLKSSSGADSQLHVEVVFVDDPADAHLRVTAHGGEGQAVQNQWFADSDSTVHAHELGHQLGLLDEYQDPKAVNRATPTSPGVQSDQSMMGNFWIRDPVTGDVIPDPNAGLKPRHLDQMSADIKDKVDSAAPAAGVKPPAPEQEVAKTPGVVTDDHPLAAPAPAEQDAKLDAMETAIERKLDADKLDGASAKPSETEDALGLKGGPSGASYVDEADPKAIRAYKEIAATEGDIAKIAEQLGVDEDVVAQVKQHIFENEYDLPVVDDAAKDVTLKHGNFVPDETIAESWKEAQGGFDPESRGKEEFMRFLAHEYIEKGLMAEGMPYKDLESFREGEHGYYSYPTADAHGAHDLAPATNSLSEPFVGWAGIFGNSVEPPVLKPDLSNLKEVLEQIKIMKGLRK
jgi:hypothetical protein